VLLLLFIHPDVAAYKEVGIQRISPRSGKKTYYPVSDASIKPAVGMVFDNIEAAKAFYERYALAAGFSIRSTTQRKVGDKLRLKYFVCSKEGHKPHKSADTLSEDIKIKQQRRNPSKRTGCDACLRLELTDGGKYSVYYFKEEHNHPFVDEDDVHFLSANRELTFNKKTLIKDLSYINIGPVKAFNIMRTMFGGFHKVGATKADCKSFKSELNLYIGDHDADMVVQRLMRKKDCVPNFSCEFIVGDDGILKGLFWADEEAKRSFYTFGDSISFDATYRHNK